MINKSIFVALLFINTHISISQSWQIVPNSPVTTMRFEDLWFINADTGWVIEYYGQSRILKTTDGGLNFVTQFSSVDSIPFRSIAFNNSQLGWAGTINGSLYRTTNGGTNWLKMDSLISPAASGFCDMWVVGDSMMTGTGRYSGPAKLIKTTNGGQSFTTINMSSYASLLIGNYFKDNNTGWAGGKSNIISEGAVVLYTINGGTNWSKVWNSGNSIEHTWYILPFNSTTMYASIQKLFGLGAPMSYIISTNSGLNWNRNDVPVGSGYAEAIGFVNNMTTGWITCGNATGMSFTTNSGINWFFNSFGENIHSIQVINDTIAYACGKKIYKYTKGVIGIHNQQNTVPITHLLYQNFPNPFNPSTMIKYFLRERSHVLLEIYTVSGEHVSTLVSEFQNAGEHEIEWYTYDLPTGVYFYTMITEQGILNGKAMLIK